MERSAARMKLMMRWASDAGLLTTSVIAIRMLTTPAQRNSTDPKSRSPWCCRNIPVKISYTIPNPSIAYRAEAVQ